MKKKHSVNSLINRFPNRIYALRQSWDLRVWCIPGVTSLLLLFRYKSIAFMAVVIGICCGLLAISLFHGTCLKKNIPAFWPVAFIVTAAVSLGKYLVFNDPGDVDMACYVNVLSNTANGHFMYHSFLNQNLIAIHSSGALLLFLPFYILAGNVGILVVQAAFWIVGIYLIFKSNDDFQEIPSLFFLAAVVSPYLISPVLYGFHVDILLLPAAGGMLYAYKRERFIPFMLMSVGLFFVKEVFMLIPLLFSFLAIIEKRKLRWVVLPSGSAVVYLFFYWFYLAPQLRMETSHVFSYFLPEDMKIVLGTLFSKDSLQFLFFSLMLYLPILMLAPKCFIFPLGYILFYAILPDSSFRDPWRHYVLSIGTVSLFPVAWAKPLRIQKLAVPLFIVSLCALPLWVQLIKVHPESIEHIKKTHALIRSIPEDKSLIVHGPFVSHCSGRSIVGNWMYKPADWYTYDYLLFDKSFRPGWWNGRTTLVNEVDSLAGTDSWIVVADVENVILLKKAGR